MQLGEFVVAAYVGVVRRQSHEEVHKAEDDQDAGEGCQDEHDFGVLHKVLAEHFDLGWPLHLHTLPLSVWKHYGIKIGLQGV